AVSFNGPPTANPLSFSAANQTITFTINFNTGSHAWNSVAILLVTGVSPNATNCSPAPTGNTNENVSCTAPYITTAADVTAAQTLQFRPEITVDGNQHVNSNTIINITFSGGGPSPQTINFTQPPDTALTSGPVTLNATASSGLAVSFSSTTTGVCTVS